MNREEVLTRIRDLQKTQEKTVNDGIRNIEALDFSVLLLRKTRWIPCSEKEPETGEHVLISSRGEI